MTISELIAQLVKIRAEYGNIEVTRLDGMPLDRIDVDGYSCVLERIPLRPSCSVHGLLED